MNKPTPTNQADFDRLALLASEASEVWDHNRFYHPFLLSLLPAHCDRALEVGSGAGDFTRLLAERASQVVAVDLSPNMIDLARRRSAGRANIDFRNADVMKLDLCVEEFDCIVSIATLHHLPAEPFITRSKEALKPDGRLLILDLRQAAGGLEVLRDVAVWPLSLGLRLAHTGRLIPRAEVRRAWKEHGKNESYPTMMEVRDLAAKLLPGALVRRHLLWRYSVVWRKP